VQGQADPCPIISRAVDGSTVRAALQDHVRPQCVRHMEVGVEEGGEEEEDEEKESRDREEGLAAMPGHGAAVLREGGRGKGCPGRAQALGLWGSLVGESPVPYACGVAREGGSEGGGCEMSAKICLACLSLQAAGKQVQQQALPIFQCVGISPAEDEHANACLG
jgi:hypothetical protein